MHRQHRSNTTPCCRKNQEFQARFLSHAMLKDRGLSFALDKAIGRGADGRPSCHSDLSFGHAPVPELSVIREGSLDRVVDRLSDLCHLIHEVWSVRGLVVIDADSYLFLHPLSMPPLLFLEIDVLQYLSW